LRNAHFDTSTKPCILRGKVAPHFNHNLNGTGTKIWSAVANGNGDWPAAMAFRSLTMGWHMLEDRLGDVRRAKLLDKLTAQGRAFFEQAPLNRETTGAGRCSRITAAPANASRT